MVKTKHVLSYLHESSFGVPSTDPIVAGTQTYLFGEFEENQSFPTPQPEIQPISYQNDRDASVLDVGNFPIRDRLNFNMMNGIWLWYALGQSTNSTPTPPPHRHALTGCWAAGEDKFDLPSFTIHHEQKNGDSLVEECYGCKINTLTLSGQSGENQPIVCEIEYLASKVALDGNVLTTPPVLPATAATAPYRFPYCELDWNEAGAMTVVQNFNLKIMNNLKSTFVHRTTDEQFAKYIFEGKRQYSFVMNILLEDFTFLTALLGQLGTEDFTLKLPRATSDEILVTMSNNRIFQANQAFKVRGGKYLVTVGMIPQIVSIQVDDSIDPLTVHYVTQA